MAAIPSFVDPTLAAIDSAIVEKSRAEPARAYLGMSQIGKSCERELWFSFRWAVRAEFDAAALKRFDDGFRTEDVMAARLRMVAGIELHTVDAATGDQFRVSDHGGHFSGHMDGAIRGLLQAPKAWHVWECKAVNDDKFGKLGKLRAEHGEKATLALWDPVYYGQAIAYMHYTGMDRHYLTATTPGGRQMDAVRTEADPIEGARIAAKAYRIITAAAPPTGISTNPAWFECKWCPAHALCHAKAVPAINCRTCLHATPELTGNARWSCALHKRDITAAEQRTGCPSHRFIPALVSHSKPVDADAAANWVEYETPNGARFRNGDPAQGHYTSEELRIATVEALGDPQVAAFKAAGARIVAPEPEPAPEPAWTKPRVDWSNPGSIMKFRGAE